MSPTVQWEAYAGVTHAWIAQCDEGYVSLCGREVAGFGGQRSGIRCGLCATRAGWAEATGESSSWTPHGPMIVAHRDPLQDEVRSRPDERVRRQRRPPIIPWSTIQPGPVPPVPDDETPALVECPDVLPDGDWRLAPSTPVLQVPETMDVYQGLPIPEQHYWAPVMLARAGQVAVWDQGQETAEHFQQRCYEQLQAGEDQG